MACGNRVNFGFLDAAGANVNNNHPQWDDNDNLRVCVAWNFHPPLL